MNVITSSLAVVTNYKIKNSTHYLACSPRRRWHHPFQELIAENADNASSVKSQKALDEQEENNNSKEDNYKKKLFEHIEIEDTSSELDDYGNNGSESDRG